MADLKVGIAIEAKDGFSAEAGKAAAASRKLAERLGAAQRQLAELGARDASLKRLDALGGRLGKTSAEMDQAARKTAALRREFKAAEQPSKKLERAFEAARAKSTNLRREHRRQREELRDLRRDLREAGVETRDLGEAQRRAADDLDRASRKMREAAGASERFADADRAWGAQRERMAQVALVAQGVERVGSRMRQVGLAPLEAARPVVEARGRLAQLGMDEEAVDTVTRRGRRLAGELPEIDTRAFLGAAYAIQSGIESLDPEGVADMAEMAAVTARSAVGDIEGMARLFTRGYNNFKQLFPQQTDREFGGSFAALVTKSAQLFDTTGPKLEQAIERMGPGLSLIGISAGEQFAALGMLQGSLGAAEAGGRLAALERSAKDAQDNLRESGRNVRILDERDNLLPPSELVAALRAEFGAWSSVTSGEMQKVFGTVEAAEVFKNLWDSGDDLARHGRALDDVGGQGDAYARAVQQARDDNPHAQLQVFEQRMTAVMEEAGQRQLEALEKPIRLGEALLNRLEDSLGPGAPAAIGTGMGAMAGIGTAAEVVANLAIGGYGVRMAKQWWDRRGARAEAAKKIRDLDVPPRGGGFRRIAERAGDLRKGGWRGAGASARDWGRALPGKALQALKGKHWILTAVSGAASLGSVLSSESMSEAEKAEAAGREMGALGGGTAGWLLGSAAAGALAGSIVPGLGTAAGAAVGVGGGLVGSYFGGRAGWGVGGGIGRLASGSDFEDAGTETAETETAAPAPARGGRRLPRAGREPEPSVTVHQHNNAPVAQISIQGLPGEDVEDLARRVARLIGEMQEQRGRGALADAD